MQLIDLSKEYTIVPKNKLIYKPQCQPAPNSMNQHFSAQPLVNHPCKPIKVLPMIPISQPANKPIGVGPRQFKNVQNQQILQVRSISQPKIIMKQLPQKYINSKQSSINNLESGTLQQSQTNFQQPQQQQIQVQQNQIIVQQRGESLQKPQNIVFPQPVGKNLQLNSNVQVAPTDLPLTPTQQPINMFHSRNQSVTVFQSPVIEDQTTSMHTRYNSSALLTNHLSNNQDSSENALLGTEEQPFGNPVGVKTVRKENGGASDVIETQISNEESASIDVSQQKKLDQSDQRSQFMSTYLQTEIDQSHDDYIISERNNYFPKKQLFSSFIKKSQGNLKISEIVESENVQIKQKNKENLLLSSSKVDIPASTQHSSNVQTAPISNNGVTIIDNNNAPCPQQKSYIHTQQSLRSTPQKCSLRNSRSNSVGKIEYITKHPLPAVVITESPAKISKQNPLVISREMTPRKRSCSPVKVRNVNNQMKSPELTESQKKQKEIQEYFSIRRQRSCGNIQKSVEQVKQQDFIAEDELENQILNKDLDDCKHELSRTFEIHQDPFWFQKYCFECQKWFFYNPQNGQYRAIQGLLEPPIED